MRGAGGYNGKLLVGLFNISSTPFPLILYKKLIAATFYRLADDELSEFSETPPPVDRFPDDLVRVIREYQPIAIQKLAASLEGLEVQVSDIRREMRDKEDWAKRFEGYLDANNQQIQQVNGQIQQVNGQIKQLTEDLQIETEQRKAGQAEITKVFAWLKGAGWTLVGVLGLALGAFVAWLVGVLPTP